MSNLKAQKVLQSSKCVNYIGSGGGLIHQYSLTFSFESVYKQLAIKKIQHQIYGDIEHYKITELPDAEILVEFTFVGDDPYTPGKIGLEKSEKVLFQEEIVLCFVVDAKERIVSIDDIDDLPCIPGQ